jgi:hypothetical protein
LPTIGRPYLEAWTENAGASNLVSVSLLQVWRGRWWRGANEAGARKPTQFELEHVQLPAAERGDRAHGEPYVKQLQSVSCVLFVF